MPIASTRDGTPATIQGRVSLAGDKSLRAPLSERPCIYWEVNLSLGAGDPETFDGLAFWLEDDSGRLLVQPESVDVDARAEGRTKAISVVDANINEVAESIRQIKDKRSKVGGREAARLTAEHRKLKKLATFLCALRAHARGRVHTGGSLKKQEAYIQKKAPDFEGEAVNLVGERFEVILSEGDELEIRGLCVVAMLPPGVGASGGYRDSPTCLQMRAPVGGRLQIRGLGGVAPVAKEKAPSVGKETNPLDSQLGFFQRLVRYFRS
jgi:hypothetical protein